MVNILKIVFSLILFVFLGYIIYNTKLETKCFSTDYGVYCNLDEEKNEM